MAGKLFKGKEVHELTVTVLRFAVGAVFLWFGLDKWIHPSAWYGWIPKWTWQVLPQQYADSFLYANGAFEAAVGLLLVAGRLLRPASAAAGLFLLAISFFVGVNEVTIRDNALLGSCIALFLNANARARRKIPQDAIAVFCSLYVIYLFVYGVLYLRVAP